MEVIWSDFARQNLDSILDYVEDNFGVTIAKTTLRKIHDNVNILRVFPESGVQDMKYSTMEYSIRHVVVGSNVLYYMVYSDAVVIGTIVHSRQAPKTIDKILTRFLTQYQGN